MWFGWGAASAGSANRSLGGERNSTTTSVAVVASALARPDVEGHAGPAPRVDLQAQGGEGLDVGVGGDALLVPVAPVLAPDHVGGVDGRHGPEHLGPLVPQGLGVDATGGSMASSDTTWRRWFWTTSRMAPASS